MVTDKAEVDGLPKSALALAAQQAGAELKKVSVPDRFPAIRMQKM